MRFLSRLQTSLIPYAPLLAGLSISCAIILLLFLPLDVFAQAGDPPPTLDSTPGWINRVILNLLWTIVVTVFGFWVTAGGYILNYGLGLYVVGFGDQYLGTTIGVSVDNLWVIVRDLFNLTFIFGLVYLGIRMILNSDDSNTKRNLIFLIMAALLVNFSLFITKFVVDFTNVTATQFLNNIESSETFPVPNLATADPNDNYNVPDIAQVVIQRMQLTTWLSGGGPNFSEIATSAGYAYVIFTAIVLLIAGFVFISGGLLLIIRFIVLNFYMIFSPIMFLGWVFPNLQSISSRYWKGFLGRAFFAPVYVILLYISLTILAGYFSGGVTFVTGAVGVGAMFSGDPSEPEVQAGFVGTAIPFIIVSGFLLATLIIAQKLGADGANMAVSVGNNLRQRGQRALINGTKWGVANTAGRGARRVSENIGYGARQGLNRLQSINAPERGGGVRGWAARRVQNTARSNGAERAIGGAASAMQNARFGMSTTRQQDRAFASATASAADNRAARRRGVEVYNSAEERAYREWEKRRKAVEDENKADTSGRTKNTVLADGTLVDLNTRSLTTAEQDAINAKVSAAEERQKAIAAMQTAVNDLTTKDIEQMSAAERDAIAEFLSQSQSESAMKSDNISAGDKKSLAIKRQNAIKKIVEEGGNVLSEQLQKLSNAQLETLGIDYLNKNAQFLSDKQIEELAKSKNFTESQISNLKAKREADMAVTFSAGSAAVGYGGNSVNAAFYNTTIKAATTPGGASQVIAGKAKKASEIAKMPAKILTDRAAVDYITADVLQEIVKSKSLTLSERTKLAQNVLGALGTRIAGGLTPEEQAIQKFFNSQKNKDEFNI